MQMLLPPSLSPLPSPTLLRQLPFSRVLSHSDLPITHNKPNPFSSSRLLARLLPAGTRWGQRIRRRTIRSCSAMPTSTEEHVLTQECLSYARAFWVMRSLIAWNTGADVASVCLYASWDAKLCVTERGVQGEDVKVHLELERCGLPLNVLEKFPHIKGYKAYTVPAFADLRKILKCQLAIASFNNNGKCSDVTSLQLPGVLDDLFAYNGPLGATFSKTSITLNLWAPTAQDVHALLYKDPLVGDPFECIHLKDQHGVWGADGPRSWEGCYYVYQVSVYHQSTLKVENCTVNDPYARGISSNGRHTLMVDLYSENLKPSGWDDLVVEKPELLSLSDISIYELHIRDFSANDQSVHPDIRGGYLAFICQDSLGINHLKKLSNAGLSHVHLLPSFQFAGVDDDKNQWKHPDDAKMTELPADSEKQQFIITSIQDEDGYNWGYNPVFWGVPKGSYASNPNGPCRILEFRKMIQALNRIGLRVVLDVVYNHVHASGPVDENSILDKVVPGYYLRRNIDGCIQHSTCINNTASEHFMVERLIIDDLLCWAAAYKPNGYDHGDEHVTESMLSASADHIQIGLAGNLRDFVLTSQNGAAVNYVSAHDNETLFDVVCMKSPVDISVDDRCRMNHVASSIVTLSQGIPFFHCGDDMLRSKSLDRDSYNSGDWFNRLDFSYQTNNWGVGLPPREKNENNWHRIRPLLGDSSFKPHKDHILAAIQNFIELLKLRYSSQLFRLQTANDIQQRVRFLNTGPSWVQGVIVMSIEDGFEGKPGIAQLDQNYSYIVVVFNARPTEVSVPVPALKRRALQLHPVQLNSADNLVKRSSYESSSGCFIVPQRTTAVFVEVRAS